MSKKPFQWHRGNYSILCAKTISPWPTLLQMMKNAGHTVAHIFFCDYILHFARLLDFKEKKGREAHSTVARYLKKIPYHIYLLYVSKGSVLGSNVLRWNFCQYIPSFLLLIEEGPTTVVQRNIASHNHQALAHTRRGTHLPHSSLAHITKCTHWDRGDFKRFFYFFNDVWSFESQLFLFWSSLEPKKYHCHVY